MSELNNKYREIDPELDEFSQNAIKADYRKVSEKIWPLETKPIYIHDPSFF
jgi:hypothetical protein